MRVWGRAHGRGALLGFAIAITAAAGWPAATPPPAEAQGCALCVSFVTTVDRDGPEGNPGRTRMHPGLLANVPYALDVDGTLPPLPLGVLPLLPGYEVRVNVQGLDASRPKITIAKLIGAPLTMPLRIEVVKGSVAAWTSLGYDTLASNAPQSFVADVNTSNRDGDPETEQALVDATITGAPSGVGKPLALVTEEFGGNPAGTRTNREVRRLEFVGDGAETRIPGRVTADLTSPSNAQGAPQRQRVVLTRDARTRLNFEVSAPGTSTTGTVDELPARIDVTLTDVDVSGDGKPDKKIDYAAASVARNVVLNSRVGDDTTKVVIDGLPSEAHLTYASPKDRTDVTYHANGRAARAQLESESMAVVDGARKVNRLTADVRNLPQNIDELTRTTLFGDDPTKSIGTKITYLSDGRADRATVRTDDGAQQLDADVLNLPEDIDELTHTTRPGGGRLVYRSDARADRATIRTRKGGAELDATIGGEGITAAVPADIDRLDYANSSGGNGEFALDYAASDPIPHLQVRIADFLEDEPVAEQPRALAAAALGHRREITTTIDDLPTTLDFRLRRAGSVEYLASAGIGQVRVIGTDERPFFSRATDFDLRLTELPARAGVAYEKDHYRFDAHGGELGEIELLASDGSGERLGAGEDGVRLRDTADEFGIFARLKRLRKLTYDKPNATNVDFTLDARSPSNRPIRVDSIRDVNKNVYQDVVLTPRGVQVRDQPRDGTERLSATLSNLPPDIELHTAMDGGEIDAIYTAEGAASSLQLNRIVTYRGDPIVVTQTDGYVEPRFPDTYPLSDFDERQELSMKAVPVELVICRVSEGNDCTEDVFTDGMFEDYDAEDANSGSLRLRSTPRTDFFFSDVKTERAEFRWARSLFVPPACEGEISVIPPACTGKGLKPIQTTTVLDASIREYALQAHSEGSGAVGRFIGHPDQGYLAIDTGWRDVVGFPNCAVIAGEMQCNLPGLQFNEGHLPPPASARLSGEISTIPNVETPSERVSPWRNEFLSVAPAEHSTQLLHGPLFGASQRVFEGDPDELIFAKHYNGHVYCDPEFDVLKSGSSSRSLFCGGEVPLPEGFEP